EWRSSGLRSPGPDRNERLPQNPNPARIPSFETVRNKKISLGIALLVREASFLAEWEQDCDCDPSRSISAIHSCWFSGNSFQPFLCIRLGTVNCRKQREALGPRSYPFTFGLHDRKHACPCESSRVSG